MDADGDADADLDAVMTTIDLPVLTYRRAKKLQLFLGFVVFYTPEWSTFEEGTLAGQLRNDASTNVCETHH